MQRPMNFVMISPHFPTNFETFAVRLRESGFNTLGIADTPYEQLSEGLRNSLTEYYRVDNMEDYEQVYRAVGYFAHKYGRIDRVESHNEYWLELDAKLRTDFNVSGYKTEDMLAIKTKAQMKEVFRKAGLKVAKGRVFKDDADARKLAKELKFPVIIKPNSGVGASDTYKIKSEDELEAFFGYKNVHVEYIMEEFIEGDIVTFDGLTDKDGNIVFYSSLEYSEVVLDTVEKDNDMFYYVPREIKQDLVKLGEKCVEAFKVRERFFHFEYFRVKKTGELMPLEINCRPPGGLTIDMWNYANDFDVFKEYANIVKENKFYSNITHPWNVVYISRKANKNYKHSIDEVCQKYAGNIISVQTVPGVFAKIMGEHGILARTETMEQMHEIVRFAQEKQ
ncbi:carbamoylphosphate synthase large subunit (split gene in MJ)/ATP-dependent carboxylate-amine ligase [Actinobacillus minor NM305]|uniref:Carbamoylphosphate synthase large subunit (Split gene in MJ)/ATP-dependent carboxylate-amine ligase n=1 Tax=Actinobacillus minor NM305 TaxID=637911 RepID=C5S2X9_9PAST|nr:ATP-grasp domain-containing protein [Actinobacillus minor]EER46734.1 carbamoylphosphate synthase large subunit (split gene in MJ)/ATP-dependent carboxylate-amine ligase [Actinobacillus minor NM305]MDY5105530.1 ATP-grasp domain-containing protein [Actinobacillus minor]